MELIEIGEIVNTHGIRGEMKLNPWTDDLEALTETKSFYYKQGGQSLLLSVQRIRIHKNCAIIKAEGVDDIQAAEAFRGKVLYVEKAELPEGVYYISDLIGLEVREDENLLGKVTDVFSTGANDVYEVSRPGRKPVYLPAIGQVVQEINIAGGYICVRLMEGLLEEE